MNRAERRRKEREYAKAKAQASKVMNRMSEKELELFMLRLIQDSTERLQEAYEQELNESFGFGEKRLGRLSEGVKRRLAQ